MGVPTIMLPIFWDQPVNSRLMVSQWKVGLSLTEKTGEDGVIPIEEIATVVRRLMDLDGNEGNELRKNALDLKEASRRAIEEGGSLFNSLESFVEGLPHKHDWTKVLVGDGLMEEEHTGNGCRSPGTGTDSANKMIGGLCCSSCQLMQCLLLLFFFTLLFQSGNPANEIVDLVNTNRTAIKLPKLHGSPGLGCVALQYISECMGNCSSNNTVNCNPPEIDIAEVYAPNCGLELPTLDAISGRLVACQQKYLQAEEAFSGILFWDKRTLSLLHSKLSYSKVEARLRREAAVKPLTENE